MSKENTNPYKDTVNLPKTEFPMRGNLPQREPEFIEQWTKNKIYEKMLAKNKGAKKFVMPDGPPYANGNIHIGHVLNKVLKDIVIKYKNLQGFEAAFIPGWDCHGLPIELKVTSGLGKKREGLTKADIRELCRQEANKWVQTQKEQFIRLGVIADWENPYLTLQPSYEANEVRVLAKIHSNGVLYRGEKPVYWCPTLQTALAAAEIEYQDVTSPSIYCKFELQAEGHALAQLGKKVSLVIWTTTPWTLPANLGIALNADFDYAAYEHMGEAIIIAKELKESFSKDTEIDLGKELLVFKGSELDKMKARHPFIDRESLVMMGHHVSLEAGTGCVHTAPGHGLDDYMVGQRYDLPVLSPVGPDGRYTDEFPEMKGIKIWDANDQIIEKIKNSGHLLGLRKITHSYPHNPRTRTPLIFRATPQWFVQMDGDFQLRKKALATAEKDIQFVPEWGRPRLTSMVTNTPDWCLSRQRTWGVPIPVFFCASCEEALVDTDLMEKIADLMESTGKGIEAYHDEPVEKLTAGHKCKACGSADFKKSEDILDVWFDSGVCHTAVQKNREQLDFPADIYLEGSDQHRGWFQTSLLSSMAAYEKPPFKALITHGFVNDAQGFKMSKSKGNVINPADVTNKLGAEILRLWVIYEDYGQDVSVSDEMFQRVTETYRRIRNTMRFLLGNLHDFDPQKDAVAFKDMPHLDRWAMIRLNKLVMNCTKAYDAYDFFKVYHALNTFFTVDLSSIYLDILKDRLYTARADGLPRRASQTVFHVLTHTLCGLMAPVLSFLAEEVYKNLPAANKESIFLTDFPKANSEYIDETLIKDYEELFKVRELAQKELEELRRNKVIGASLEGALHISANKATVEVLKKYEASLLEFFIVSQVHFSEGQLSVKAEKAEGEKCVRCWQYNTKIGQNAKFPEICPKCTEALI